MDAPVSGAGTGLSVLCWMMLLRAVGLLWPSMLGWVAFAGFGLVGIFFLFGAAGLVRRRWSVAFGLYMTACAVHFGVAFSASAFPNWSQAATTTLLVLSVAWLVREARRDGTDATPAA